MIGYDDDCFYKDGTIWEPKIASADAPQEEANTSIIALDIGYNSTLKWDEALQKARKKIELGHKVLWHLDVGSFKEMSFSLKNEAQGASLDLTLRYFLDNVWEHFQENSMGVLLYKGGMDFYKAGVLRSDFYDDFEVYKKNLPLKQFADLHLSDLKNHVLGKILLRYYAADIMHNFLLKLRGALPASIPNVLFIDNDIDDHGLALHLVSKERWEDFCIFGRGFLPSSTSFTWGKNPHELSKKSKEIDSSIALLVPPASFLNLECLQSFFLLTHRLIENKIQFRIIPDPNLIFEWHGLDLIHVASECVEIEGIRRLQGLIAAGGEVSIFGPKLTQLQQVSI